MTTTATILPLATEHHHDDLAHLGQAHVAGSHRPISEPDRQRYERNLGEILAALGLELDTPGTGDTPRRFVRALFDATDGYEGDPKLLRAFPTECRGGANCELAQVVEGPIPFFALCEHHVLPFLAGRTSGTSPTIRSSGSAS